MIRALALIVSLSAATSFAQHCPARASWPTTDWPKTGVTGRSGEVKALEDYAFTTIGTDAQRNGIRTDALLIIKDGNIIYERYARGWSEEKRHISWSVAKSISTTLIGVAVKQGLINIDESICTYLPRYAGKPVCAITVKDMMTFGPGLQWQEDYENKGYQSSSVISMLLGVGHQDQVDFVLTHQQKYERGKHFLYSTGTAHVVAAIAKAALKSAHGNDAFWSQLFEKVGMQHVTFEEDVKGNPLGGSYIYAPARDYAKLGYLALNDGCWAGERLLPEGWMKAATTTSDTFKASPICAGVAAAECDREPAGYMWWLNQAPVAGAPLPHRDLPASTYHANGHWGQYIMVFPEQDVVVVRLGDDRNGCPSSAAGNKVDGIACDLTINELGKLALAVAK